MLTFGDFPGKQRITRVGMPDDGDEIGRVHIQVEETLHRVYLERADSGVWRSFHFPLNAVLVVKEEPC